MESKYSDAEESVEIIKQAAAKPFLPEKEWNFGKLAKAHEIPAWQLNHWLNYEYARSNRAIIKAVQVIPSKKRRPNRREEGTLPTPKNLPRFAHYLKTNYPEFPQKPWLELDQEKRELRLAESAGIPAGNPFEDDILRTYDSEEFWRLAATGAITIDKSRPQDERFAIFEIDFSQSESAIRRGLERWVKSRRCELQAKYKSTAPSLFESHKEKVAVGHKLNRSVILTYLKQLGALRLMIHYGLEVNVICEALEMRDLTPPYRKNGQGWTRACSYGINLMKRLAGSWKYGYYPEFILGPSDKDGGVLHHLDSPEMDAGEIDVGKTGMKLFFKTDFAKPLI